MSQPQSLKALSFKPDKSLPSVIDVEEAILGGILLDRNAIERVSELLPEHFYVGAHAQIFDAALSLHQAQKPCDLMSVASLMNDRGILDEIGGQNRLSYFVDQTVSAVNIDHYAELVIGKWQRRQIISKSRAIASLGFDETVSDAELKAEFEEGLTALFEGNAKQELVALGSILEAEVDAISVQESTCTNPGMMTGFHELDSMIGGLNRSDLVIVAGRTSMGKSAFVASLARNLAPDQKVALFSLEMSSGQIARRMLSAETSISSNRLRDAQIGDRGWQEIGSGLSALVDLPIYINDSSNISVNHIRSQIRKLKSQQGSVGVVMIDYLHLMMNGSSEETRELGKITRELKRLARELDVCIVLLSQLNRSVESRQDKRPTKPDLRQSGSIEEDADVILMLYRDEYYNPDSSDRGIAEVIVAKNRHGATGTINLLFEGEYSRFRNLASAATPSPSTAPKKPSTPAPSSPQTIPAKKEPAKVAIAASVQTPPEPDEVEGFRHGDRVEVTLDNFDKRTRNEIKKQDDCSLVGLKGTIVSFRFSDFGGNHFDPVIAFDGAKGSFNKAAIYLRKLNDSECDDF